MRALLSVSALMIAIGLLSCPALADKRVALVIGNSNYRNVPKLINPENDASAIGLLLKTSGFDVVEARENLSNADMRRSIRDFSQTASDADIAIVFYAGHGFYADLARGQQAKLISNVPEPTARPEGQKPEKRANLVPEPAQKKEIKKNDTSKLSPQERCLAGVLRRQGRFMPEGQSTSCMWATGANGQLVRQGTCQKSRSDAIAMCRSGSFGGG
jgi:Caspase domain